MPHKFVESCYAKAVDQGKAKAGNTVFLKSRPDIAMTVRKVDRWNRAAYPDKSGSVSIETVWLTADGTMTTGVFTAAELSL